MVILAVLGVIGIIYIIMVQTAADTMFTTQLYQKVHFKEKAYYMSRSAYVGIQDLFLMDNADVDTLNDLWAQEDLSYDLEDEQLTISAKIIDLNRFLDVNYLLSGDDSKSENVEVVRRLFRNMQIEPELVNAIMDWIDVDQEARNPMGADGMDYTDIPAKGMKLDSLEELKLIKGVEPYYSGRTALGKEFPGLKDVFTVYSGGKVNINTADKDVLMSLDDEMNSDVVEEIIRVREVSPIEKMDDMKDIAGMNSDLIYRLKKQAQVNSTVFMLVVSVESLDKSNFAELTVIFQRGTTGGKILLWKAQ